MKTLRTVSVLLVLLFACTSSFATDLSAAIQQMIVMCTTIQALDGNTATAIVFKQVMEPHGRSMGIKLWITQLGDSLYLLMEAPVFVIMDKTQIEEIFKGMQPALISMAEMDGVTDASIIVRNSGETIPRGTVTASSINFWK